MKEKARDVGRAAIPRAGNASGDTRGWRQVFFRRRTACWRRPVYPVGPPGAGVTSRIRLSPGASRKSGVAAYCRRLAVRIACGSFARFG